MAAARARTPSERGELRVTEIVTVPAATPAEVLRLVGALAAVWPTPHPVLRALAGAAEHDAAQPDVTQPDVTGSSVRPAPAVGADGVVIGSAEVRDLRVQDAPGTGVGGVVRLAHSGLQLAHRVLIGGPTWLAAEGSAPPAPALAEALAAAEAAGATAVLVAWSGSARAAITLRE